MTHVLRLAFEQANPTVGDLDGNAQKILDARRAHADRDLVVFPECFLSGYPLEDLALRSGFIARVSAKIQELAKTVRDEPGPALLFGAPVAGSDLPRNAGVLIRPDGTVAVAAKTELPNNDVFDEVRVFAPAGERPRPLTLGRWRLGVMICEDMWHGRVARALGDELADILIVLNGSPFEEDKQAIRIEHARRRAIDTRLPVVYVNLVGGQDELVFDGASFAIDAQGHRIAQLPFGETASFRLDLRNGADGHEIARSDAESLHPSTTPYPGRLESIYRACVIGVRDYVEKVGAPRVFIGISGGIDSALVASMAADALGPDRVTGIMLPSRHTSTESLALAEDLMRRLGIRAMTLPIIEAAEAAESFLAATEPRSPESLSLARENIQARLRGLALMAFTNAEGGLLLSTGNKSEMSVGYATLYGDMAGGFNPLKDVYKTDVWALARWRNSPAGRTAIARVSVCHAETPVEPIPAAIIDRPPTAELADGQSDEQALGSYAVLDELLKGLIEDGLDAEAARRQAEHRLGKTIGADHALRIARLVRNAEHKRRQAPPGLKLSMRGFGKGWRYPIVNKADL